MSTKTRSRAKKTHKRDDEVETNGAETSEEHQPKAKKAKKDTKEKKAKKQPAKTKAADKGDADGEETKKKTTKAKAKAKPKAKQGKGKAVKADVDSDGAGAAAGGEAGQKITKPRFKLEPFNNDRGISLAYSILYVTDAEKSLQWYKDVYGFEVREQHGAEWVAMHCGNTALALHTVKGKTAGATKKLKPGQAGPGFFVPDLDEFHKNALEHGAVVLEPPTKQPWGGYKAEYADPDGIPQSVVEVKPDHKWE